MLCACNMDKLLVIALPVCKGVYTVFTGQREREGETDKERGTERERVRKGDGERERERVRKGEGERKR